MPCGRRFLISINLQQITKNDNNKRNRVIQELVLFVTKFPMSSKLGGRRVTLTQGLDKEVINPSLLRKNSSSNPTGLSNN